MNLGTHAGRRQRVEPRLGAAGDQRDALLFGRDARDRQCHRGIGQVDDGIDAVAVDLDEPNERRGLRLQLAGKASYSAGGHVLSLQ